MNPRKDAVSSVTGTEQQPPPLARDHSLPQHFFGISPMAAPPAPALRRTKHPGIVYGTLSGIAVAATLTILQTTSNLGYDAAVEQFHDAAATASQSKTELRTAASNLDRLTGFADEILTGADGALVDVASKDALTAQLTDAAKTASTADSLLDTPAPRAGEKPTFFWQLYGATQGLNERRADLVTLADDFETEAVQVSKASDAVDKRGTALVAAAASAAAPFEAAHLSARNTDVVALREAVAEAAERRMLDASTVTSFAALQKAAASMLVSERSELAEKAGPLLNARLEVEAFARSLAPGVIIDFDWAPIVNGAGYNGSMGGYTTWWWHDPGYATIELSNSVAQQWPSIRSKSLVAHEVGHAISVKCPKAYDSSTQDNIEKWATAWAISKGFTDDANGVWAYGYPPQTYIDAAAQCR